MKLHVLLRLIFAFAILGLANIASAKPSVSYAGGDGSSVEKAIIVNAPNEESGVDAEYKYIQKHFPGYKRGKQALTNSNGKAYDIIEFTTAKGEKKSLIFDISAFFGK